MSPVSPVFHTEAAVSIGLKNVLRVETSILTLIFDFYLGCQGKVGVEFQNKVKTLIHNLTENRIRHASGPVHALPFHYMYCSINTFFNFVHPITNILTIICDHNKLNSSKMFLTSLVCFP